MYGLLVLVEGEIACVSTVAGPATSADSPQTNESFPVSPS